VGTIKIFDFDVIETHNLNRQSLFCEQDVKKNKAEALAERLQERNSSLVIIGIDEKIEEDTINDVIRAVDVVIDCVDLIYVRRILSRFCLENNIPLVHGGISWIGGQTGVFTRYTPCINCIFPEALQKQELDEETSCTRKPEASVVYTAQIIAGFMVEEIRKILLPLKADLPPVKGLLKLDFRFSPPVYFEPTRRKLDCECLNILTRKAPDILADEQQELNAQQQENNDEIQKLFPKKKK
jgi:adenylyltransferase/sulfurtransferase